MYSSWDSASTLTSSIATPGTVTNSSHLATLRQQYYEWRSGTNASVSRHSIYLYTDPLLFTFQQLSSPEPTVIYLLPVCVSFAKNSLYFSEIVLISNRTTCRKWQMNSSNLLLTHTNTFFITYLLTYKTIPSSLRYHNASAIVIHRLILMANACLQDGGSDVIELRWRHRS